MKAATTAVADTLPPLPEADLEEVVAATAHLWSAIRGGRIFITGGTGFFGVWLLETFVRANRQLNLGASAAVLSRDPAAFVRKLPHLGREPALEFCAGDVRSFDFPTGSFSHVIHAATEAGPTNADAPLAMLDTIVQGTRHVLDFVVKAGVRKYLLTSSGAVYGTQPPGMTHIPEEYTGGPDPLNPHSAYGEGKRMAEHLSTLYAARHGFEVKIARCFTFVGPHLPLDANFAIGNFIRDAMRGGPIRVNDGAPRRSYLYAADLATWLWTILFAGQSARAYNVGSRKALSIAELAEQVRMVIAPETNVSIAQAPAQRRPPRYVPNVDRAERELGLKSRCNLGTALQKTANWATAADFVTSRRGHT